MRYHHSSWNDVDRALEAFRYARRSLLVVMAIALPFAAWETTTGPKPVQGETVKVQQVAPVKAVRALHAAEGAGEPREGCGGEKETAAPALVTFRI